MKKKTLSIILTLVCIMSVLTKINTPAIANSIIEHGANWTLDSSGTLSYISGSETHYYDVDNYKTDHPWSTHKVNKVVLGDSIKRIYHGSFEGHTNLTEVIMTDSVEHIYNDAFARCYALKTIKLSQNIQTISNGAFLHTGLEEFSFPPKIDTIPDNCFFYSTSLKRIYIPKNVTVIRGGAFTDCSSLTDIYYEGSEADWKNITIYGGGAYKTIIDSTDVLRNATIHYNSTGIGNGSSYSPPTVPYQNYSLAISPSSGKSTINNVQGTGTTFEFTAVTAPEVNQISLIADKFNGASWHEITYDYLVRNYHLEAHINSNNLKVWTCRFGINEHGYRTFKLKVNGVETNIEAYVNVLENSGSFSPTPQQGNNTPSNGKSVKMYSPDGRTTTVLDIDVAIWQSVGWYTMPVIYMYATDGRFIVIDEREIDAWANVGWYPYPVAIMYAPDGRSIVVSKNDIVAWQNVGWYTAPVITMYAPDGRTIVVYTADAQAWQNVGWYYHPFTY